MSEWRRTPLAMHQRRGAGGGVRACGARARERERRAAERRGARAAERDSIADGTALRYIVGEEVAATFGDTEDLFPEGSFRGHYPMYTSSNTVWLKVLGYAPLSPRIENYWGPRTNEICVMSLRAIGYLLTHAECLLSVRQKKKILRSKDKDVRFTELLIWGERKKSFGQLAVSAT